jgi:hypothetical protein
VTIAVSANLPTERIKAEGEKPDDAKAKDEEFAARLKALNEKIAKDQSLAGRTFELSKNTLDALLKERETLVKKAEPTPAQSPSLAPGAKAVEAVTQPIEAPAAKGFKGAKKPAKREKR